MPTLTATLTLAYGDTTPSGAIPQRLPLTFSFTYTETSVKRVHLAAGVSDSSILLDSVSAPAFLLVRAIDTDVSVKVSDGVVATPTPTALSQAQGWLMVANPSGQPINRLLVTTPASPTTGATIEVLAFE